MRQDRESVRRRRILLSEIRLRSVGTAAEARIHARAKGKAAGIPTGGKRGLAPGGLEIPREALKRRRGSPSGIEMKAPDPGRPGNAARGSGLGTRARIRAPGHFDPTGGARVNTDQPVRARRTAARISTSPATALARAS